MVEREDLQTGGEIVASTAAGLAGAGAVSYGAKRLLDSEAFKKWQDGLVEDTHRDRLRYQQDVGARYKSMARLLTDGSTARGALRDYGRGHISSLKAPKWMVEAAAREGKGDLFADAWGEGGVRLERTYAPASYHYVENKIVMNTDMFNPNTYLHELGHAADRASLVKSPGNPRHNNKPLVQRARLGAAGLAVAGAGHDQEWAPALAAGSAAYGMWSPLARAGKLIDEAKASYNGYKLGPLLEKRLSDAGYVAWKWDPKSYRNRMWLAYKTYLAKHAPRVLRAGGVLAGAAAVGAGARAGTSALSGIIYGQGH